MKIPPSIYAKSLIELTESGEKNIAGRFWHLLQKNKQYKDLTKILDVLDEEYAKKNNQVLVKVYSDEKLDENVLQDIKSRLSSHPGQALHQYGTSRKLVSGSQLGREMPKQVRHDDIIIKNFIKPDITGIIVQVDDKIIDLTAEDKIKRLKKIISN